MRLCIPLTCYCLKDPGGNSPLHYALRRGHEKMAIQLTEMGADIRHENKSQQTPMFVACQHGLEGIHDIVGETRDNTY